MRPWTEDDVDALHQLWIDPDVRRYLWDDVAITRERAAEAVRAHFESVATRGIGYWAVHPADDQPLIGFCGFRPIEREPVAQRSGLRPGKPEAYPTRIPDIEIVYGLLPAFWGRGLATEAARAALDYLRETGHTHVYARTDAPNEKSIGVLRRLGFRQLTSPSPMLVYLLGPWKKA